MAKATVAFGLRARQYDAVCTNVQQQLIKPSEDEPMERTNLSFSIQNISPFDLKDSGLLYACFRLKDGGKQLTVESALGGTSKAQADYNSKFEVLALDKGTRHDEDATHSLSLENLGGPLSDPDIFNDGLLRPRSGLVVKTIRASENQIEGDPRVDIDIIAKGFDHWVGGYGWLISGFTLGFVGKQKSELDEDAADPANKKRGKNPDQADLPID